MQCFQIRLRLFPAVLAVGVALPALAAEPFGVWTTSDGESRMKISACGADKLCGNLVGFSEPNDANGPKRDAANADPALRQRPLMGVPVLLGLTRKGELWQGKMYNPEDGKTYDGSFSLKSPTTAEIRGCVAAIFCQSEKFVRQ